MPHRGTSSMLVGAILALGAYAAPAPTKVAAVDDIVERATTAASSSSITNSAQLASALSQFSADAKSLSAAVSVGEAIFTNIVPLPGPTAIAQAEQELKTINSANPNTIFDSGAQILLNGLAGGDFATIAEAYLFESSSNNINLRAPIRPVYPSAGPNDAPYSLPESQLRASIYIPPSFTYGRIPAVLFFPGTAGVAGQQFAPNYGKLFTQSKQYDPVYVNVPNQQLGDLQLSAEYTSYAINYISGISGGKNVSTISWSAGSLNGQWGFKYWPSTRQHVTTSIRLSPDYHGTIEAQALCPGFVTPGCTPAIAQQNYNATFINTLRSNGGDSAYVPTTDVYTIFDEIVEPQQDPNASGFLKDARGVGVTNVEIQSVCTAFLPAGAPYVDHEGTLYNALGYALALDALSHGSNAQLSRVNATYQCQQFAAPGLSLNDILATEAVIPIAGFQILAYEPKVASEPPLMPYAQSG